MKHLKKIATYKINNLKEKGEKIKEPFEYSSGTNIDYLSVGKIERFFKKLFILIFRLDLI